MAEDKKKEIAVIEINEEFMKQKLYEFRGCKVLLDADLAEVYGYELKAFNQQVKRNISSKSRSNPYVFTEQGVYMLMTVLKGELAVRQSIALVRTFKRMKVSDVAEVLKDVVTKSELADMMNSFVYTLRSVETA